MSSIVTTRSTSSATQSIIDSASAALGVQEVLAALTCQLTFGDDSDDVVALSNTNAVRSVGGNGRRRTASVLSDRASSVTSSISVTVV